MDTTAIGASGGLIGWIADYGNAVYFFAQLAYWLCIVVLLAYAVVQFKRWVNFQLGTGRSGKLRPQVSGPASAPPSVPSVSVDEFVE